MSNPWSSPSTVLSSHACAHAPPPRPDGFLPPQRFLDRVALHIARNALADTTAGLQRCKVPLLLGIWGHKVRGHAHTPTGWGHAPPP